MVHEHSKYTGRVDKYWVFALTEREAAVSRYLQLINGYLGAMNPEEQREVYERNNDGSGSGSDSDSDSGSDSGSTPDTRGDSEYHIEDGVVIHFKLAEDDA